MKSGWRKGENAEIAALGTKDQPRSAKEVGDLLKWMPDLLDRIQTAQTWRDSDNHPRIAAVLLKAIAPLLEAVDQAFKGNPADLQHLYDQIRAIGSRQKRHSNDQDPILKVLFSTETGIEWTAPNPHLDKIKFQTKTGLADIFRIVEESGFKTTKNTIRNKLKLWGLKHGSKLPKSLAKTRNRRFLATFSGSVAR